MSKRSSDLRKKENRHIPSLSHAGEDVSESTRLADEVQRLKRENAQRNAELAILNSVQEGLASKLDIQSIYEMVGEQLHEVFPKFDISVAAYDPQTSVVTTRYMIEHGKRIAVPPFQVSDKGFIRKAIQTRKTIVVNENLADESRKVGSRILEGTATPRSHLLMPLIIHDVVRGFVGMQDMQREHAFSVSDVRLLETIANSMIVALENVRLFDETQRLLQETEQRAAELAIINSVQEGLASKLDVQSIYDLVGDKIRDIFHAQGTAIYLFDHKSEILDTPYCFLKKRFEIDPRPFSEHPIAKLMVSTRQPITYGTLEEYRALGGAVLENSEEYKSGMYVPLMVGKELKGMVGIANLDKENAYDHSDFRLLQTLANSMSVALENARLFDETEQRAAELAIINSVQEGLASKLDMQAIYDLVGDKIRELFHNTDAEIRIYDPQTHRISFPYFTDNGKRIAVDPIVLSDLGISSYVLRTGKTIAINENLMQEIEKYGAKILPGGHPAKSAVFVPLIVNHHARGLIALGNVEHEHAFSESDVRLLQTLANSMSTALENARLFDETQTLLKETEQRAAELAIINSVQEGLASKLDMQAIYDLVGDKIRDLFNAQSVWIQIYDPATRTRQFRYGFYRQRVSSPDVLPYNRLTEHLIATKKPLVINQNAEARKAELEMVIVAGSEMFKSAVFVPLIAGREVKGAITLQNMEQENVFSESDVSLLSTLASSMSVALENARLFDETQRLFLEAKEARTAAEQANQAKSTFLSSMSHELRTPLNAIINFVEMIARGMIGPVNQDQVELLDQALHSSKHLLNLINDVLDISKIQAGQLTLFIEDQVSVQVELETTLSILGGLIQEKGLQLIRDLDPHLPMVSCDRRRLRQVLLNLISNSIKFTDKGTITVSVKNRDQELLFAVIDTGPGIPPDKQEMIFQPFIQAENGEKQLHGTGLGLPISRSLIRAHGGDLWVESDGAEGSAFFFTLPVERMSMP